MTKWLYGRSASLASALFLTSLTSGCAYFERLGMTQAPQAQRGERANMASSKRETGRSSGGNSSSGY